MYSQIDFIIINQVEFALYKSVIHGKFGKLIEKIVFSPSTESTEISPFKCVTASLAIYKPMPEP